MIYLPNKLSLNKKKSSIDNSLIQITIFLLICFDAGEREKKKKD